MTTARAAMWALWVVAAVAAVGAVWSAMDRPAPSAPPAVAPAIEPPPAPVAAPGPSRDEFERPPLPESDPSAVVSSNECPLERGTCAVVIRLRDADGGAPVDLRFALWRVAIPADDVWSAGDREYAKATPVDGVARIEGMPEGRYRICCNEQRKDADDPPEFRVPAGSDMELAVHLVRSFRARLRITDLGGSAVGEASKRWGGGSISFRSNRPPPWATKRTPHGRLGGGLFSIGSGHSMPDRSPESVRADAGYFELPPFRESTRESSAAATCEFGVANCVPVDVRLDSDEARDTTFVGVAVPAEELIRRVLRPDGLAVDPATTLTIATCSAVANEWDAPLDAWRSVPVHVQVLVSGFRSLEFRWTYAERETPRVLVPSSPK